MVNILESSLFYPSHVCLEYTCQVTVSLTSLIACDLIVFSPPRTYSQAPPLKIPPFGKRRGTVLLCYHPKQCSQRSAKCFQRAHWLNRYRYHVGFRINPFVLCRVNNYAAQHDIFRKRD